jgi:hypothetical protein
MMCAMPRTAVILQSNYLPWRGYFDLIARADAAILFDSVQYTRRDWRNRNRIKTAQGPLWITVPVEVKGRYTQAVDETQVANRGWAESHIRSIDLAYRQAGAFAETAPWLFGALTDVAAEPMLTAINERLIRALMAHLGIATPLHRCTGLLPRAEMAAMDASQRLVALCGAVGADRYLSGPAAKAYLDETAFARAGITVDWMRYDGYPDYPQCWGAFEPQMSIVDLLLNTGADAMRYIKAS